MLIIEIIIFLIILFILISYFGKTKENFYIDLGINYGGMTTYRVKFRDCDKVDWLVKNEKVYSNQKGGSWKKHKPCGKEERVMSDLNKKIKKALEIPKAESPLSGSEYKKFFNKREIGIKPQCYGHECHYWEGRGKKEGRDKLNNFLKHKNNEIDYYTKNKLYRIKEIPIEMNFYDKLKKIENVIGKRWDSFYGIITNDIHPLDLKTDFSSKEIKNKKVLDRMVSKMVRAKVFFSKKKALIVFKLKPSYKQNLYWTIITEKNEDDFFYIQDILKDNNVPMTNNEKC